MRKTFDDVEMAGTIVIGEGERDEAPMLFIGEQVGVALPGQPEIDIAVDPLEGTNLVAMGLANAITVLAASEKGGLLNAPDTYMEKLCVGPIAAGHVDIRLSPVENLNLIAEALGRKVGDLTVVILDRPRHADADRPDSRRGSAHQADLRRRPFGRGQLRGHGHGRARGHGHGRCAGRRPHRGRAALPGWRDPGAPALPQRRGASTRRAHGHIG